MSSGSKAGVDFWSVYLATSPSGKQYVGKTKKFKVRVKNHFSCAKRGSKTPFHSALRKYGNSVKFEEVFCAFCEAAAFEVEKLFIQRLNTCTPHGYNCTQGGEGQSGRIGPKHPNYGKPGYWVGKKRPDIAAFISKRDKGKKYSDERKKRISETNIVNFPKYSKTFRNANPLNP